ncbi:MAG TPA: hypothetical protein VGP44_12790 [Gemmatimonadales bacterium]|nr:hypothetical protein [Gemmatimonadales bacterium]
MTTKTAWLRVPVPTRSGEGAIMFIPRHMTPWDFDIMVRYFNEYLNLARPAVATIGVAEPSTEADNG